MSNKHISSLDHNKITGLFPRFHSPNMDQLISIDQWRSIGSSLITIGQSELLISLGIPIPEGETLRSFETK